MRAVGRLAALFTSVLLVLLGGLAMGLALAPESGALLSARDGLLAGVGALVGVEALGLSPELPMRLEALLGAVWMRFVPAPIGLVVLVTALLPGRSSRAADGDDDDVPEEPTRAELRVMKKAKKEAASIARSQSPLEAAEYAFEGGLLEEAASYFIAAEAFERAAEVRHAQDRFIDSAELYARAGRHDAAGSIFSQHGKPLLAAEAYQAAGNLTIAAELFEEARDFRRAGDSYAETGFLRQAADAYQKCDDWEKAARCLDEVIREETVRAGGADPAKQAELAKLVKIAGYLYEQAGLPDEAEAVLTRGGDFGAAAEIALRCGRSAEAAEMFLKAGEATRAAAALREVGDTEAAARIMAEHHRDRGDDAASAEAYEVAGDFMAAGDAYRLIEQYLKAAACYEQHGDPTQAAEMFALGGDRERAAANFERAGMFNEAAELQAGAGDVAREAELLERAGDLLRAGELHLGAGDEDAAIEVLQKIGSDHADFTAAAVLIGNVFRKRGMLPLAIKKLEHATHGQEPARENLETFHALASAYEEEERMVDALALYEKILAADYNFGDIKDRIERVRAAAEASAAATGTAPASQSATSGRYLIQGQLGRGGMGIVYKAQDTVLDRIVAYKVLPDTLKENPQALKNFLREAKSAARLNHPNIVTVYDAGEQDGAYYIAMEYVDGNTLKEIVQRRGAIAPRAVAHVTAQMCEALAYAHEQQVVHRDVKSANTMWTRDRKAKLMDFGLAKVIEEVRNHTTVVSGTPYYMSPEQTEGKNIDHRTDLYSLGVTVFELATGTLPFTEGNLPYHHVHTAPPDPRTRVPELPETIAKIVLRCMEKDPNARFQSAREILELLTEEPVV